MTARGRGVHVRVSRKRKLLSAKWNENANNGKTLFRPASRVSMMSWSWKSWRVWSTFWAKEPPPPPPLLTHRTCPQAPTSCWWLVQSRTLHFHHHLKMRAPPRNLSCGGNSWAKKSSANFCSQMSRCKSSRHFHSRELLAHRSHDSDPCYPTNWYWEIASWWVLCPMVCDLKVSARVQLRMLSGYAHFATCLVTHCAEIYSYGSTRLCQPAWRRCRNLWVKNYVSLLHVALFEVNLGMFVANKLGLKWLSLLKIMPCQINGLLMPAKPTQHLHT